MSVRLADVIVHQTQPTPCSCVHTCIAMALGIPVADLVAAVGTISLDRSLSEESFAVWLAERGVWMRPMVLHYGRGERLVNGTLYLVGVRSLNRVNSDHCVLLDTRPPRKVGDEYNDRSGWQVFDPNRGREGPIEFYEWVDEYTALDACELRSRDHISGAIGSRPASP